MDARVSKRTKRQRAALGGGSGLRAGFGYWLRLGCCFGCMVVIMSTQPEALRLADELDQGDFDFEIQYQAAAELRRLHSVNAELLEALEWIVQYYRIEKLPNHMVSDYAKTAIAKATGETK
jgi:hypothetical protein